MSKPLNAAVVRVGDVPDTYDIERVTVDPRVAGLVRSMGTLVQVVGAQGVITLMKYASWNTAWRPPGEGPIYPTTQALFQGATKLVNAQVFNLDQVLGNVVSLAGTQTLVKKNTPTFQQTIGNKVGIYYDGATDSHEADVNAVGLNSFCWGGEFATLAAIQAGLLGRYVGATDIGYSLFVNGVTGAPTIRVSDGVGGTFQGGIAVDTFALPVQRYLFQGQVDRTAGRIRARLSRAGVGLLGVIDTALGAIGTLTGAAQGFGFGATPTPEAYGQGAWASYGWACIDPSAEGADVLRDIAVGLGYET